MSPEELSAWQVELRLMRSAEEGRCAITALAEVASKESTIGKELRTLQGMADDLLHFPYKLRPGKAPPRAAHLDRRRYERALQLHQAEIDLCTNMDQLDEMAKTFSCYARESKKADPMIPYWLRLRIKAQLRIAYLHIKVTEGW